MTRKEETGCGTLYVTVSKSDECDPIELFAYLGKTGGCARCQNEAITRCISLGLKYGIPASAYVEELKDLQCVGAVPGMKEDATRVLSCADAIARILGKYIEDNKI